MDRKALERAAAGVVDIDAKTTVYVVLACLVAASGGLLFGYDGGCTGGVESFPQFQRWWFPSVIGKPNTDFYCKYDDKVLSTYSAIMHFTGALASLPASYFTQHYGRTRSMIIAGTAYCLGSILQAAAMRSIAMLFIGRVFWGIGVGFGDHCAFIYTAEMAPPKLRGRLNSLVQCGTITGIVIANAINVGTINWIAGWRISLGLAFIPGSILLLGGLFLPDTPNSLVERGHFQKAREVLRRIRGTPDVDVEYETIVVANDAVKHAENPWKAILRRRNRPQLALAIAMPFFQQWSGVNAISFFAPQIFAGISTFNKGLEGPLYAALLVNGVQWIATIVTVCIVDKVGRRPLLISASIVGTIADFAVAILFAQTYNGTAYLPYGASIGSIVLIGLYSLSFGWGWGPIGWLIPSEVHDLNTRSAGQSITVFTQLLSGAIVTEVFLQMMCTMKYGVFIFFGLWQFIAIIFCVIFLPEMRGVPIEEAADFVRAHWAWRRIAYPGGRIPASDKQKGTQLSNAPYNGDSKDPAGASNKGMHTYNPTFDSARGPTDAHANGLGTVGPDAVSRANAA
jgi:sugar porter (SP) family MFS transporter